MTADDLASAGLSAVIDRRYSGESYRGKALSGGFPPGTCVREVFNHRAKFGLTALMLAVINQHTEIVRLLVDAGAALDIQGSGAPGLAGKTALDIATAQGAVDMIRVLGESAGRDNE